MILGDPLDKANPDRAQAATLDAIFRRAAQRRPDALALADPPNRAAIDGTPPRRLTFREAERAIEGIAARLRRIGLARDAVVAIQLPNVVDGVLAFLGCQRAGLIASPLPQLWRRAECSAALAQVSAKAIITCARAGDFEHGRMAMELAADLFTIRQVCAFGDCVLDGIVPLDNAFTATESAASAAPEPGPDAALHVAAITWDIGREGPVPIARNHVELIAGGFVVLLELRAAQASTILTTMPPTSFAGLSTALVPWVLSGGALVLHQPFDAAILGEQIAAHAPDIAIVPGQVVPDLSGAGALAGLAGRIVAVWRAPERVPASPTWRSDTASLVDISVFGETGLIAARRDVSGRPALLPFGPIAPPSAAADALQVAEAIRTESGTLALRGPMIPRHAFPGPGALPRLREDGFTDTGYLCRVEQGARALAVTGAPPGVARIGGYTFALGELQHLVSTIDREGTVAALPDALSGQRLAGRTADAAAMRHALQALGVNPLVAAAFRERGGPSRTA